MTILSRWFAPAVLAAGLGFAAMTPAPVHAQDSLTRALVDIADVVFNNGTPYYRYGNNDYNDRLIVSRDRYGRPVYYRQVPYGYNTNGYGANGYGGRQMYDQYGRRIYDQYGRRINYSTRYDYSRRYNDGRSGPPYGNAYGYYGKHKSKHKHHGDDHDRNWDGRRGHDHDD